jgi:hypothetical protein
MKIARVPVPQNRKGFGGEQGIATTAKAAGKGEMCKSDTLLLRFRRLSNPTVRRHNTGEFERGF